MDSENIMKMLIAILERQKILIEQMSSLSRAIANIYELPIESVEEGDVDDF